MKSVGWARAGMASVPMAGRHRSYPISVPTSSATAARVSPTAAVVFEQLAKRDILQTCGWRISRVRRRLLPSEMSHDNDWVSLIVVGTVAKSLPPHGRTLASHRIR